MPMDISFDQIVPTSGRSQQPDGSQLYARISMKPRPARTQFAHLPTGPFEPKFASKFVSGAINGTSFVDHSEVIG